jgi:XRE family transcriptional regulator, fatty acid utilization regulator
MPADEVKQVGSRIRRHRHARGWSLATLAEKAGLTTEALGRLERGEQTPRLDTLFRIARGLEVDPRVLLTDDPATAPLEQDLAAVIAPLADQPPAIRAAAARIVRALIEG